MTFGIGIACVGVAAVLLSPLYPVNAQTGQKLVLIAFVIVVMGGLGSIAGAFYAALIIGLVDAFAGFYLGSSLKDVAVFGIFLLVLIFVLQGCSAMPENWHTCLERHCGITGVSFMNNKTASLTWVGGVGA